MCGILEDYEWRRPGVTQSFTALLIGDGGLIVGRCSPIKPCTSRWSEVLDCGWLRITPVIGETRYQQPDEWAARAL